MRRGDIVIIADPGTSDLGGKPRPALVVQSDTFLDDHASVTVCLITSHVTGYLLFRVPLPDDERTGLLKPSEVSIDKVQTVWRDRVGKRLGHAPDEIMFTVDQALRRWLGL